MEVQRRHLQLFLCLCVTLKDYSFQNHPDKETLVVRIDRQTIFFALQHSPCIAFVITVLFLRVWHYSIVSSYILGSAKNCLRT